MKILVTIKRVVDYNVRVRVKSDGSGVETDGVKMSINPFDEIALEEALRIKERGQAEEVIVVSIGGSEVQQQLRTGLAMGADRAIHVETDRVVQPLPPRAPSSSWWKKNSRASCSWASRPSTMTATRPARCWPRCGAGRRRLSLPRSS